MLNAIKRGLDILSFNRISKPVTDLGLTINAAPRCDWSIGVIRNGEMLYMGKDGKLRHEEVQHRNMVLGGIKDRILGNSYLCGQGSRSANLMEYLMGGFTSYTNTLARIGTSAGAVASSQTDLLGYAKNSTSVPTGNSLSMDPSTGNFSLVCKRMFDTEISSTGWNEIGIYSTGQGNAMNVTTWLYNRLVFPSTLNTVAGDQIVATMTFTFSTLAVNAQTVTLSAQNGVDISGSLKLIGTTNSIVGGTCTTGGVITADYSMPFLPVFVASTGMVLPSFGLNTATSFPAYNTAASGMNANLAGTTAANAYTNGSFTRSITGTWGSGQPASDTAFRSIMLTNNTNSPGTNGYQLLLNAQQTKVSAGHVLTVTFQFSLA
jgi:hypothetical protein